MINKKNFQVEIDLIFKNSCENIPNFSIVNDNQKIILKKSFWENAFLIWFNILINEFKNSLPKIVLNKKDFSLGLEIVDNLKISQLNSKFLNKTGPTDVLSFPIISEDDSINNLAFIELGDIFISLEMAITQSLEYNNSICKEMIWLASHGFLHLLGWDHQDQKQLDNMIHIQEYLISKLNININNK